MDKHQKQRFPAPGNAPNTPSDNSDLGEYYSLAIGDANQIDTRDEDLSNSVEEAKDWVDFLEL